MKLFTYPALFRSQKVLIAAQYAGVDIEVVTEGVNEKSLKGKSAAGKCPVLETPTGTIFESNAIARYIARIRPEAPLYGEKLFDSAMVDSWLDFCVNEIEVPATALIYPILGWMDADDSLTKKAQGDLKKGVMLLEQHLKSKTFMVGRGITLADIALVTALLLPMKLVYDEKQRKAFPCVTRWFTTCVSQPEFAAVLGQVSLCKQALKAAAGSGKAAAPKKKEEKKKKKEKKKKEAAPAPAPAKKKAKNPLDELPKSSFILDAWKKQYSNAPGGDCYKAMPWFWENGDFEGYSLHIAKYKYNEENKVAFMVSNLIGGFVQRCDEIRKYAFGCLQIVGKEGGPMEVIGCWLMRGQSIQPLLDCNPDAEYYEYTKQDPNDPATRKRIEDLWCAWEAIDGKPVMDAKVFK